MTEETLRRMLNSGALSHLDCHFADFMVRLAGGGNESLRLAAALVSAAARDGHICLDLRRLAGTPLPTTESGHVVRYPTTSEWRRQLLTTPVVGTPGDYAPLILDRQSRLYLYRYRHYQQILAEAIAARVNEPPQALGHERLRAAIERLFPERSGASIDRQKVAAFAAARLRFVVISGGPGTGKTTTVAKILALLIEQGPQSNPRIALTAPTGKAVARLREAIKQAKQTISCAPQTKEAIPEEAATIHRLLGSIPNSPYFRHNRENPLAVEVVVVDEASMVDLALMAKLFQALPSSARVMLLGDKDQLASVEAGAVLGDICDTGRVHGYSPRFVEELQAVLGGEAPADYGEDGGSGMRDAIIQLQHSYRFAADGGISLLSRAVNAGSGAEASSILQNAAYPDVRSRRPPLAEALPAMLKSVLQENYRDYLQSTDPLACLRRFDRFRILCAVREGPWGVQRLNRLAEQTLAALGWIEPAAQWYHGRPVMIRRNDYNLHLFNGDVGIALSDPEADGQLRVYFPGARGTVRKFHPQRLPQQETVFTMTVHKSQGSEFDRVLLILPDRDGPVLTRELLYTAITRAREEVEIWTLEGVFTAAAARRTIRMSGLRDALWAERRGAGTGPRR